MQYTSARWIDHAGNNYAHTFARTDLLVVGENLPDATREFRYQNGHVFVCLKTADYAELVSEQIGDHDVGARCANIYTNNASLSRVDIQKRWPTTTADGFTNGAFKDQRFVEEFADEKTRNAAPNVHQARQVSAGNRLMGANKIESDLAVDLAARSATGHCEIVRINLSHGYIVCF